MSARINIKNPPPWMFQYETPGYQKEKKKRGQRGEITILRNTN